MGLCKDYLASHNKQPFSDPHAQRWQLTGAYGCSLNKLGTFTTPRQPTEQAYRLCLARFPTTVIYCTENAGKAPDYLRENGLGL